MIHATVVRYTTREERADENEALIRAVFAELAEKAPSGLRYQSIRLDDGVTFVHLAVTDGGENPLSAMPAFGEFVSAIADRCIEGPTVTTGTVIGTYGAGQAATGT
jgi:hypothetical protein